MFDSFITVQVESEGQICSSNLMVSSAESEHILGRNLINHFSLVIWGSSGGSIGDQPDALSMVHSPPSVDAVHALMCTTKESSQLSDDPTIQANYASMFWEFPALELPRLGHYPFQHRITLQPDTVPVAFQMHPVPLALHEKVEEVVCELDRQGVWEPCEKSEWMLCMVTPMKPTGEVCITTDFSLLNKSIIPFQLPLPVPEDLFQQTQGSKFFSKLDLVKAFHNIELHPDSRTLTTTLTPLGLRQYRRLPLGLIDSGAVCQKLVYETLADLEGVAVYIDDILIYSETVEQHDSLLWQVYMQRWISY